MGKTRSELELFMRKIAEAFQLGFQFKYGNRKGGRDKKWSLEVWDQRPGHYKYIGHGIWENGHPPKSQLHKGIQDPPSIHWYPKLDSDSSFVIKSEFTAGQKDEFIKHILFNSDFFEKLGDEIPGIPSSFSKLELKKAIEGRDVESLLKQYHELKKKYGC